MASQPIKRDEVDSEASDHSPDGGQHSPMTLVEHLGELRTRIVVSLLAVACGAVIAYVFEPWILEFLARPYEDITGNKLIILEPLEGFMTRLRISGYAGLFIASPMVLWQLWRFITPGLHPHEKRFAIPFVIASLVLFVAGAALALWSIPRTLDFLLGVGGESLEPTLTAGKYLSFVTLMMVAFGIAFELPVILMFLLMAGVVTSAGLAGRRRFAAVAIVTASAVITPSQDPYTMLFMAVPMYVSFELVILLGRIFKR